MNGSKSVVVLGSENQLNHVKRLFALRHIKLVGMRVGSSTTYSDRWNKYCEAFGRVAFEFFDDNRNHSFGEFDFTSSEARQLVFKVYNAGMTRGMTSGREVI